VRQNVIRVFRRAKNPKILENSSIQQIWKNGAELFYFYVSNTTEKKMNRLKFTSKIIDDIEKEWMNHKNES